MLFKRAVISLSDKDFVSAGASWTLKHLKLPWTSNPWFVDVPRPPQDACGFPVCSNSGGLIGLGSLLCCIKYFPPCACPGEKLNPCFSLKVTFTRNTGGCYERGGETLPNGSHHKQSNRVFIPFLQSPFQTLSCLGLLRDLPVLQLHWILSPSSLLSTVFPPVKQVTWLPAASAPTRASQSISTSRADKELPLTASILFKRQFGS